MKTINNRYKFLAILLLLAMGFVSCGDDDDPDPSKMIVGKWKLVKIGSDTAVSTQYYIKVK